MIDPFVAAAHRAISDSFHVLKDSVRGLEVAALNRRPAGPDTNSIAVLAAHASGATRLLVALAVGAPLPDRDRPAEFATTAGGPGPLLEVLETAERDCLALLDRAGAIDWGAIRRFPRADGTTTEMTAAWALLHGVDHLRGHADEAALTRHLVVDPA